MSKVFQVIESLMVIGIVMIVVWFEVINPVLRQDPKMVPPNVDWSQAYQVSNADSNLPWSK
jgi:hypothetical protein